MTGGHKLRDLKIQDKHPRLKLESKKPSVRNTKKIHDQPLHKTATHKQRKDGSLPSEE